MNTHEYGNCNCMDEAHEESESSSIKSPVQENTSILSITRSPVQCPISGCHRNIGITLVLSHYLRDHPDEFGVKCQETFLGKHSVLVFDPAELELGKNICLGVLAYGGPEHVSNARPAETGLSIYNAFLPETYEHYKAHLPILIMACRTTWSAVLPAVGSAEAVTNVENPHQQILVIWLASEPTTRPIHCTITVYDQLMSSSRSAIVKLRHLNFSQNPKDFVLTDTNSLRLCYGEFNNLSKNLCECIRMEIIINEYH